MRDANVQDAGGAGPVARATAVALLICAVATGCASGVVERQTRGAAPAAAHEEWVAPVRPAREVGVPAPAAHEIPPELLAAGTSLSLAGVLDVALRTSPTTRASWLRARAAAAGLGSENAAYLPTVDLSANVTRLSQSVVGGLFTIKQTNYGPALALNYLLLDFGGRSGKVEEARQALLDAGYTHNAALQDVVLQVLEAYYAYLDAKAQQVAADANVREAKVNLDAAITRQRVGVATVADRLQAKTQLSQAELFRQTVAGQIEALRGALATAMGLPANTPYDVGELPTQLPTEEVAAVIDPLIERALAGRPDLAAAMARADKAQAHVRRLAGEGLPTVSVSSSASRTYYSPQEYEPFGDNWSVALTLRYPLFTGFRSSFDIEEARALADAGQADVASFRQRVVLEVWTAHADLKTAVQQVATSRDLLASATELEEVALGRYREGVGGILDLLTAQRALASARAEEIRARTRWLVAVARLAHATGALGPDALEGGGEATKTTEGAGDDGQK